MSKVVSDQSCVEERFARVLHALRSGVILLNSDREITWIDDRTRARLNGGAEQLAESLRVAGSGNGLHCCLYVHEVTINGEATSVCLVQESDPPQDQQGYDAIATIEAAMAAIVEKIKAFRQVKQPAPRTSDLDILSDREREVLGMICEGRSDAQMGSMLELSQNTIRNHIASLYRKIGVNRRSAAIIWARERGITSEALSPRRRTQPRSNHRQK